MSCVEPYVTASQNAYQRQRSAEVLLADMGSFVQEGSKGNQVKYLAGLDIGRAFDAAGLIRLIEALDHLQTPRVLSRFIGNWITARSFRVRPTAPTGQYLNAPYTQTQGVPHGGVLPTLLWLLLVDRLPDRVKSQMRVLAPELHIEPDLLTQIFADDISIDLRSATAQNLLELTRRLGIILHRALQEMGLK